MANTHKESDKAKEKKDGIMIDMLKGSRTGKARPDKDRPGSDASGKPDLLTPNSPPITDFDQRIIKLRSIGKRRGRRNAVIGISASFVITFSFIYVGSYLLKEIVDYTGRTHESTYSIFINNESARHVLTMPAGWRLCDQAADCAVTQSGCCDCRNGGAEMSVNRDYLSRWRDALEEKCKNSACLNFDNCKEGAAVCKDGVCEYDQEI